MSQSPKVYSVTTLHAAAEEFEAEAPFQIAIIELPGGGRRTVRIVGDDVGIDDDVEPMGENDGVTLYRKKID